MGMEKLLKEVQVVAIVCNQWGDSGKGKMSDYFSSWADVIARGTGGNNAGHTVMLNGKEKIFHFLPSGIIYDGEGKINVLGNGMVIEPLALCEELNELDKEKLSYNNLMISKDAHVILPFHISLDKARDLSQKKGGVGSTGRGIGPCYRDKISRRGIFIEDLFDRDKFSRKIKRLSEDYPGQNINSEEIIDFIQPSFNRIKPFVRDTVNEMHNFYRQGKKISLEGAQGLLLSIEHGTYPYVTSSDCSLNGTCSGVGLPASVVDLPLGVVKFPFMTRVGAGPFPTEFGKKSSEQYCAAGLEHDIFFETKEYLGMDLDLNKIRKLQSKKDLEGLKEEKLKVYDYFKSNRQKILELCNSSNSFKQGVGIRLAAAEYGATTARPRRIGWTDAVAARYAVGLNGPLMVLTKPDSISGIDEFKICYDYKDGNISKKFSKDEGFLRKVNPVYQTYKGYGDISSIRDYMDLPSTFRDSIDSFENFTGGKVVIISNGRERDATIIK